jgi:hypothetical protein
MMYGTLGARSAAGLVHVESKMRLNYLQMKTEIMKQLLSLPSKRLETQNHHCIGVCVSLLFPATDISKPGLKIIQVWLDLL